MKIALISYEYPPDTAFGGIGTYSYQLAHMLRGRGHVVEVFAGGNLHKGSCEEEGILVHRIQEKQGEDFRRQVAMLFAERHQVMGFDIIEGAEHKADALYIQQQSPELPLVVKLHTPSYLLGRLFRGKVSIWDKTRFMLGGLRKGSLPKAYWHYEKEQDPEYQITLQADAILAPSHSMAEIVAGDWQIDKEKIMHLPNLFVPHPDLLSLSPSMSKKNKLVVTFIGKLERRKGILDLVQAAGILMKTFPQMHLRLVGAYDHPAPQKNMLMYEYVMKRLPAFADRLEMTGPVLNTRIPKLLSDTDISIFPSLWEASGYVCQEAMAADRAVIGSSAGGMAEMIEDGENGLLIPPQSPEAIVKAVTYLIEHPEKRQQFGIKAREKVLKTYNEKVIGEKTEAIYQKVISNKKSRQYA